MQISNCSRHDDGPQDKEVDDEDISIKTVYTTMWKICKLKRALYLRLGCVVFTLSSQTSKLCAFFIFLRRLAGQQAMLLRS